MNAELDSDAVAQYLLDHTEFFEQHAELLARIRLSSPVLGKAISLQERQMEILREKNKTLELHMANLIHLGQDNDRITERMQEWSRTLLMTRHDIDLPNALVGGLQKIFALPDVTLRLWGVAPAYADSPFAQAVSEDAHLFANGLIEPFCGPNHDFEAAGWLDDKASVQSLAMLALRKPNSKDVFGLLVMGSADAERFSADMATDFLAKIGDTASAALSGLLVD
jgi:uncharacterized protein YigA (DUF484 family)